MFVTRSDNQDHDQFGVALYVNLSCSGQYGRVANWRVSVGEKRRRGLSGWAHTVAIRSRGDRDVLVMEQEDDGHGK